MCKLKPFVEMANMGGRAGLRGGGMVKPTACE